MTHVIWVGVVNDVTMRIAQESSGDCVVEYTELVRPDVHDDSNWSPIDDDAQAAQAYMTAYLQARETLKEIQTKAFVDDFTSR